jgi:Protein of unknown function (DUF4232)
MRFRTSTALAAGAVAAGLAIAGCSSSGSASSATAGSTATATSTVTTTATATQTSTPVSAPTPAAAAGAGRNCQVANLRLALGAKSGSSSQLTQAVDLTNKGPAACTMNGFAGVDLVGAANGKQDYNWSLQRQSASYSRVTVAPGGTAHFNLIYLPNVAGDGIDFKVTTLMITPPNTFSHAGLAWPQAVLLQDGATHPGTFITPVVSGS